MLDVFKFCSGRERKNSEMKRYWTYQNSKLRWQKQCLHMLEQWTGILYLAIFGSLGLSQFLKKLDLNTF